MNEDFNIGKIEFQRYAALDIEAYLNINELNKIMSNIKITSQTNGEYAVRGRKFIVGSISMNGDVSFAANPTVQDTAAQARAECKRLAQSNPGKTFIYVQLCGAERTIATPTAVSI
jgi:hypothetical protein